MARLVVVVEAHLAAATRLVGRLADLLLTGAHRLATSSVWSCVSVCETSRMAIVRRCAAHAERDHFLTQLRA